MTARPIEISVHNALVLATAPLLMIVPYLLTFSPGIGYLTFFLGAALMGVALAGASPQRPLSISALAGFDRAIGIAIFSIGITLVLFTSAAFSTSKPSGKSTTLLSDSKA